MKKDDMIPDPMKCGRCGAVHDITQPCSAAWGLPSMPVGMSLGDVKARWPGAFEKLPRNVDRLCIDSTDGDLWLVQTDGKERVWWAEESSWSHESDTKS